MRLLDFLMPTGSRMNTREAVPGIPSTTDPGAPENQPEARRGGDWSANIVTPAGQTSLMIPTWYRCVTLVMETMGQMIIQYQRRDAEGGNYVTDDRYGDNRRLNYLLQVRPNPIMTASVLQQQIEYRKIYFGNAYVYIERDDFGAVNAMWLCTSGGYNPATNTYSPTFVTDRGPKTVYNVPASDVLHFKNTILDGSLGQGLPTIRFAIKALQMAATGDDQALQDMAKGGKYKVLVQEQRSPSMGTRGRMNRDQMKKMVSEFAADWMSHDVIMLDNVADTKVISQTAQQLQLLETRGYSAEDLCRLMAVPKIMAMIGEGGSYRMPEHATQEFLLRNIQPRIRNHEDEYNSKLLGYEDFGKRRIDIDARALRRLDPKGQADINLIHLQTGWSVNELRFDSNLPRIEGGDAHYVSTNLAEVGSEKLRGTSTELGPGNYTVKDNTGKSSTKKNDEEKGGES